MVVQKLELIAKLGSGTVEFLEKMKELGVKVEAGGPLFTNLLSDDVLKGYFSDLSRFKRWGLDRIYTWDQDTLTTAKLCVEDPNVLTYKSEKERYFSFPTGIGTRRINVVLRKDRENIQRSFTVATYLGEISVIIDWHQRYFII